MDQLHQAWLGLAAGIALAAAGCGDAAAPAVAPPDGAAPAAVDAPPAPAVPAPAPPAAKAEPSNPMSWARCAAAHGALVIPSVRRTIERSKGVARQVAPEDARAQIDGMEQGLLQALELPPAALDAVDQERPLVLVLTTPDPKSNEPPVVAVVPATDVAKLRAAIAAPPAAPEGDPEAPAAPGLTAVQGADGLWQFTGKERGFDYEAYEKATKAAQAAGQPEPDWDQFSTEKDVTKLWLAERPGLAFIAAAEAPLRELLASDLPREAPATPADDAVLWISADRLRDRFQEDLDQGVAEMRRDSQRELRGAPPFMAGMAGDMIDLGESVVRQVRDAELRVSLDPVLKVTAAASFPSGQSIAQALAEQLHDGPDLTGLLPADAQVVISSRLRYTQSMRDWGKKFFDAMLGEVRQEVDAAKHKALLDRWQGILERQYAALTGESAGAMGLHRDDGLWFLQVARATDETKARAAMRDLAAGGDELVRALMGEAPPEVREQFAIEIDDRPDAGKHRDVPLDRIEVRLALGKDVPAAGAVQDAMRRLFGGPSLEMWTAVAKGHMVSAFGRGAEARCTAALDLLLDGTTAGPGGDWPALAAAMGGAPHVAVYFAPLALMDEGVHLGVAVQAQACLRHQPEVEKAATAYHTINGAWPRDVILLYQQELLNRAGDVGCAGRYQIDPNTGRVRCTLHGTPDAPVAAPNPGEAFDIPWDRPAGPGGFAYWGRVSRQGDAIAAEVGVAMPAAGPGHFAKAFAPIFEGMQGRARAMGGGAGFAPAEMRAAASLRQIANAQAMFQANVMVDQDGDERGEFAFLGELAATEALRGTDRTLEFPMLPPILGQKNQQGVVLVQGYCYKLYLPSGPNDDAMAEPAKAIGEPAAGAGAPSHRRHADVQEQRWICYAWPLERGASGMRTFVVTQAGEVYATEGLMAPYSGAENPPPAHAALDADGGDPGNLDAGIALAAAEMRATDGNTWVPVG